MLWLKSFNNWSCIFPAYVYTKVCSKFIASELKSPSMRVVSYNYCLNQLFFVCAFDIRWYKLSGLKKDK